ncbi:MAG TPA: STAS domain-containing protein [Acidimicrobiales bacterium]
MLKVHLDDTQQGLKVLTPVGELDAFTVSRFRQEVAQIAGGSYVVIDMSSVRFLDSPGLGAVIGAIRRVRELGGDVAVACNRPSVERVLRTTGFDGIVTITQTVEDAAASLGIVTLRNGERSL